MKDYFLKTERLGFSIWNESDMPDALELWGDPEVTKFITAEGRMSDEQVKNRLNKEIDNYNKYNIQYFPIYMKETNENVGCCGLRPYDPEKNILEMGIHLKRKYWRSGLAQEACKAIIGFAFKNMKAAAIFTGHNPKNTASAKLLKKLGFKYTHDEFYEPTGLKHPSYLMTKQDYNPKQV